MTHRPFPTVFRRSFFLSVGAAMLASTASAQLIAYDGFSNGPAPDLAGSNGGSGWSSAWANVSTDPSFLGAPGLSYQGLLSSPGAAITPTAGGIWPSSIYARSFALPAGTQTIYCSFLMRDDAAYGSFGGVSFGQYPSKMWVGSPLGMYSYGLMMSQGLGDFSNKPLVQGETTLVVVKLSKSSTGGGVTYSMYLDPTPGGSEPTFPAAVFTLAQVSALPGAISIENGTGFTTDELRIGRTWNSVLPTAPSPWTDLGFAKPGTNGAPSLTGAGTFAAGSPTTLNLASAKPNSLAWLVIGAGTLNLPFLGGVLVPDPITVLPQFTSGAGSLSFSAALPAALPTGLALRFQYWIDDPAASFGYSSSNGLQGVTQ